MRTSTAQAKQIEQRQWQLLSGRDLLAQIFVEQGLDTIWMTPNFLFHWGQATVDNDSAVHIETSLYAKSAGLFALAETASGRQVVVAGHISEYADLLPALWQAYLYRLPLQIILVYADHSELFASPMPVYPFLASLRQSPLGIVSHVGSFSSLSMNQQKIIPAAAKLGLPTVMLLPLSLFHLHQTTDQTVGSFKKFSKRPPLKQWMLPANAERVSKRNLDQFDLTPFFPRHFISESGHSSRHRQLTIFHSNKAILTSGLLGERLLAILEERARHQLAVPILLNPLVVVPYPDAYTAHLDMVERFIVLDDQCLPLWQHLPSSVFPPATKVDRYLMSSHVQFTELMHFLEREKLI